MDRGRTLKELRESKQLSQTEAARHIGVSKQTLYKYENNIITNIPYDIIEKIAILYETTPASLMGWEEDNREQTVHDQLLNHYIKNESDRKLLERYHNLSPEARKLIDLVIEDDLRKNGRPD